MRGETLCSKKREREVVRSDTNLSPRGVCHQTGQTQTTRTPGANHRPTEEDAGSGNREEMENIITLDSTESLAFELLDPPKSPEDILDETSFKNHVTKRKKVTDDHKPHPYD